MMFSHVKPSVTIFSSQSSRSQLPSSVPTSFPTTTTTLPLCWLRLFSTSHTVTTGMVGIEVVVSWPKVQPVITAIQTPKIARHIVPIERLCYRCSQVCDSPNEPTQRAHRKLPAQFFPGAVRRRQGENLPEVPE